MRIISIENSIETKQQHHLSLPNKSKKLIQNCKEMTHQINTSEARVYVGTYGKYNDGSIFGEWLTLSDYADKDEFYDACRELHDDEEDPEFMFQDYENIPNGLIGECWISDSIFEVLEALEDMDETRKEAFLIWCNNGHRKLSEGEIDDLISDFDDDYIGEYKDEEDFAYEQVEQMDLPEFAKTYFDYEAYARDLFSSDYWSDGGHVFYNS
ncbi:antirestriction protein [Elizabethkingia anophelis]|uniref:antirestriction protein ArdA n=1 Tax=Elizabethkingia anophelis TaxID=1117645 RepID=UPI0021D43933|nr:antirestriction protein ArdA [Elizabethkingia anophelis]MDV4011862.1 antirestriction protein [Elizabethkingia anophelis]